MNLLTTLCMDDACPVALSPELLARLAILCGEDAVITDGEKVEKLSKDFYWYSPVLKRQLEDKRAAAVVAVDDLEILQQVVAACYAEGVPITVRGAATGNYGQCVPLYGGVVLDLGGMDRILSLEDGIARVEPGVRLGKLEPAAREVGYELRCIPSTWVKSSMGGFFCGGSGGIGSITWGGIAAGDNVKSVTLLSVEEKPQLLKLEEAESIQALHTYGTTGIMVEIEMRLAPKKAYEQIIVQADDWDKLLDWTHALACRTETPKRLVTIFEKGISDFFKPLKKFIEEGKQTTFLLIEESHAPAVIEEAKAAGFTVPYTKPFGDPPKPPYITDYTWNHTTLWALKGDPSITYLQCGFGANFREQFEELWRRFPGEILFHLEWTVGNSKMERDVHRMESTKGNVLVGGIPLVRFQSEARLQEIIDYCEEIGVFVANPHTYLLEEGGRHPDIARKYELKAKLDPKGLLNPGKMKNYAHNPFAEAAPA